MKRFIFLLSFLLLACEQPVETRKGNYSFLREECRTNGVITPCEDFPIQIILRDEIRIYRHFIQNKAGRDWNIVVSSMLEHIYAHAFIGYYQEGTILTSTKVIDNRTVDSCWSPAAKLFLKLRTYIRFDENSITIEGVLKEDASSVSDFCPGLPVQNNTCMITRHYRRKTWEHEDPHMKNSDIRYYEKIPTCYNPFAIFEVVNTIRF